MGIELLAIVAEGDGHDRLVRGRWVDGRLTDPVELVATDPGPSPSTVMAIDGRAVVTGRAEGRPRIWLLDRTVPRPAPGGGADRTGRRAHARPA